MSATLTPPTVPGPRDLARMTPAQRRTTLARINNWIRAVDHENRTREHAEQQQRERLRHLIALIDRALTTPEENA